MKDSPFHSDKGGSVARPQQWFELACRRCGGRFVEMKDLVWHRCPGSTSSECAPEAQRQASAGNG